MYNWSYFAEGNANVLFRSPDSRYLLRVRKAGTTTDSEYILQAVNSVFKPLLGDFIPDMEILPIDSNLRDHLQNELFLAPNRRPDSQIDPESPTGLLVPNLVDFEYQSTRINTLATSYEHKSSPELVIEFKPKWLSQSPTAPPRSRFCRTCALNTRRNRPRVLCPLEFTELDTLRLRSAVQRLLTRSDGSLYEFRSIPLAELLTAALSRSELLPKLRTAQERDRHGVLSRDLSTVSVEEKAEISVAMTLRDVSLFISVKPVEELKERNSRSVSDDLQENDGRKICDNSVCYPEVDGRIWQVRLKIADLDLKDINHKWKSWQKIEEDLIDSGAYMNGDGGCLCG